MTVTENKVTLGFEAEVKQLLHLMIHALYSNKEIFLRELISNASDAADKLRFRALSHEALYEGDSQLKIRVEFDKEKRTIAITDNGIGMNRDEVRENIGTIARSGTRHFFESLTGDEAKDSQLIGQFGVGFYSSFIVADKVILETREAGGDPEEGVRWESSGEGNFTLENIQKTERGTKITLHLREGEDELLEGWKLRSIIRKFSDHISLPIEMKKEKYGTNQEESEDEGKEEEWETVNSASALWSKSKDDISEDAYNEFYKHVSHDFREPLARIHSRVEGSNEYTLLLYIPSHAPFDLWDRDAKHGVKLYVRKVFIMDDAEKLMPRYLRFVRGVIDSDSLPLNVSREILQENKLLEKIRAGSVKKVLSLFEDLAKNEPEKYQTLWKEFGQVLKEGVIDDFKNRDRLVKLLRFASTENDAQEVSVEDYIARMKEGQEKIYYITADSLSAAKNSPHLEIFRKKGLEVLLLCDRVDSWLVDHLTEFDGKHLQSIARGDLDLGKLEDEKEKEEIEQIGKDFEAVVEKVKKALEGKVANVRVSHRLTDSPACLVSEVYGMNRTMERILKEAGQHVPSSKPIFEINPNHALIIKLREEADETRFTDLTQILFDQAVLSEGGQVEDPAAFVHKLNRLLQQVMA
ncbi:MAG: molecular chaperone HtpG [Methylococcaceae bacterium]|nr:molecular chaperone HtpG [Methylococcaceae bacterium]